MAEQAPNPATFLKLSPEKLNALDQSSLTNVNRSDGQEEDGAGSNSKGLINGLRPPHATQIPGPSIPAAAAVQRSAAANRSISVNSEPVVDHSKERLQRHGRSSPSWPTSPRLKSPPPSGLPSVSTKRHESGEHTQSNVAIKRLAAASAPDLSATNPTASETTREPTSPTAMRHTARGASTQASGLETVNESSVPTTPSFGPIVILPPGDRNESSSWEVDSQPRSKLDNNTAAVEVSAKINDDQQGNGSASAPTSRAASTSRPPAGSTLAKRSLTNLVGKKPVVEPLRSMTVETETVNPTSQLVVDRGRDNGGSVKAKPSTETIRPRKEKKKTARKAPSLHAGTGTSKADIFEAKVASAVDEADSSDSDETFVYESNPPEPRQSRHHSRTPSATSMTSQMDYLGRGKHGVRSGSAAIQGKKSMKFSSNMYGTHLDPEGPNSDAGRGSTRNGSSTHRHHHIGRHGRHTHTSIIDTDSPFSQDYRASSPRTPTANGNRQSRPNSPRVSNGRLSNIRKSVTGGYDTYDDGADDERAPLIGSVRVNRNRHSRRPNANFRSMEFAEYPEPRCWPRWGGCFLLAVLVALISIGITTFVLALNRPLIDVEVKSINHVLASEQELMLDLRVHAVNPNLFTISVNELDVNLFAESPYAGTNQDPDIEGLTSGRPARGLRRHQRSDMKERDLSSWFPPFGPADGVDEGTDPIEDPEPGNQKLLLGRISALDSPLTFDPSPFHHDSLSSDGAIRLAKPGNKTEVRGSERWERVIQHPFELIVRGVLKYQLPFSSRNRSAKIGGRVKVLPGQDDDDGTNSTTTIL